MKKLFLVFCSLALCISFAYAQQKTAAEKPKEATSYTKQANEKVKQSLPFKNTKDFENAQKGLLGPIPGGKIDGLKGFPPYETSNYSFLKGDAPDTVNPSLWRHALLTNYSGVFKVADRIYQARTFDIANMTIIESDNGLIIIDTTSFAELSKAALDAFRLYTKNNKPIKAVIVTHSHIDHYGGLKGIISQKDLDNGVLLLAPEGFLDESISENAYAGNAMSRRLSYFAGNMLTKDPKGYVDTGLGKTTTIGTTTLMTPNKIIKQNGEKIKIDGVEIEFMLVPGTEAPAEMIFYFPQFKALCAAEDLTPTLHNLYSLRGAKTRDSSKWWKAIDMMIERYGADVEVIFASHMWPHWGNKDVNAFMKNQRAGYKYIHDQGLRMTNMGYTPNEIAESIQMPPAVDQDFSMRGYYGSVNHDVKSVFNFYIGQYTGNPADLYPLPEVEAAKRYVEYMGGADNVIKKAQASYNKGDYRWVAEVMKHVVFADPNNQKAKNLQADALEQLGYQAESSTWRNNFLVGALELREGKKTFAFSSASPDMVKSMTNEMLLDFIGIRLNGPKAFNKVIKLNLVENDTKESYGITLEDAVVLYSKGKNKDKVDATITLTKDDFSQLALGAVTVDKLVKDGKLKIDGNKQKVEELFSMLDVFTPDYNIVTP